MLDTDILWEAQAEIEDRNDLIPKLQKKLGWTNDRLRRAAEALQAEGRVRAVLNDYDGGYPSIIAMEVITAVGVTFPYPQHRLNEQAARLRWAVVVSRDDQSRLAARLASIPTGPASR